MRVFDQTFENEEDKNEMSRRKFQLCDVHIRDLIQSQAETAVKLLQVEYMVYWKILVWDTFYTLISPIFPTTSFVYVICLVIFIHTKSLMNTVLLFLLCYCLLYSSAFKNITDYNRSILVECKNVTDLLTKYMQKKGCCYKVALLNDEIIGSVAIIDVGLTDSKSTAELQRLRVHRRYRKLGVGQLLVDAACEFCVECGYDRIILSTNVGNFKARRFHKRYGFKGPVIFVEHTLYGNVHCEYSLDLKRSS